MTTLCEKYRAKCFKDVKGQDLAISRIKAFIRKFPLEKKSLVLYGPSGAGKTSIAYALASELNAEIVELNASDLRNREKIEEVIGHASQQASLFKKNKILLIDEVDGITKDDKGGLIGLVSLIARTKFPMIITANNIWDTKFSELRRTSELVEIKELDYRTIFGIIKEIAEKENLIFTDDLLKSVAIKSKGDVRAAINDLQTINAETLHEDIYERDKEESIFNILKQIFQVLPNHETLGLCEKVNMSLDEILLWIEENLPREYEGEELVKAVEALSKADVFRGRIYKQQHWRFLIYQDFLMSAGVSAAKKQVKVGFVSYKRPSRILKIWLLNQKQKYKKSIAGKYAAYCHIGIKRAMKEFATVKEILKNEKVYKELKLEKDEIDFLKN